MSDEATQSSTSLKFLGFEVFKIIWDRGSSFKEANFAIQLQHFIDHLNSDNKNIFQVVFILNISVKEEPFNLQIQALGNFEIVGEIPEDIRGNYYKVSAPSITYPFLRAFVSNLFLQCGVQPVILPSINFTEKEIEIRHSLEELKQDIAKQ
jgi:preprotein translocase subunit SecB